MAVTAEIGSEKARNGQVAVRNSFATSVTNLRYAGAMCDDACRLGGDSIIQGLMIDESGDYPSFCATSNRTAPF